MSVQNVLQGVLSPKFTLNPFTSEYATTVDIVNVDSITANSVGGNTGGVLKMNTNLDMNNNSIVDSSTSNNVKFGSNIDMQSHSIGTSIGSTVPFTSDIDLRAGMITSTYQYYVGSVLTGPYVRFGAPIDLLGNSIFSTYGTIKFDTNVTFSYYQYGTITITGGSTTGFASVPGVTSSSNIIVTPTGNLNGSSFWVTPDNTGKIVVEISSSVGSDITFNYFIASF